MDVARDIRRAFRQLLRQPVFAIAAVSTLALGMAAPTALFTIVNATLLQPLPYERAQDIYTVRTRMTDGRFTSGLVASEELGALTRATDSIVQSAYSQRYDDTLLMVDGSRQVACYAVSEHFFDLFGLPMSAGRGFTSDDFGAQSSRRAVLSHRLWTNVFAADPKVIGSTVRLAAFGSVLVVGVAPPAFDIPHDAELWFSFPTQENIGHAYDAYLRLRPGVTPGALEQPMTRVLAELAKKYPDFETNRAFVVRPLLQTVVGEVGPTVLIAFTATGLLWLLALVNVANLLLARASGRVRDMAVRTALGAGRWDLVRQLLIESFLLSAIASAIGLALAAAAVRIIVLVGGSRLPRVDGMRIDPAVFLFAAGMMVLAGALVGLVPALTIRHGQLAASINEGGRAALQGRATRRWLDVMVVAEVVLAVALVAGAGRLLMSLGNLLGVDPGFVSAGRLVVDVQLPPSVYRAPERLAAWSDDADRALRALGATRVGVASSMPMRQEWDSTAFVDIVGRQAPPENRPNGRLRVVNAELFETLGIKLIEGRTFSNDDRAGGAPVIVVSDAWRRKFLPGLDVLRERVILFDRVNAPAEIIGVVADVQYVDVMRAPEPIIYVPQSQFPILRQSLVITTADGHPERLTSRIRGALRELDASVPVDIGLAASAESPSLVWSRLGLFLMGACGSIAVCLAWVGVFGVIAYAAGQRTGEMAVRLALGATRARVFNLVMLHGARLTGVGLAIGLTLAWWTGSLMSRYVYHVAAANLLILAGSAAVVTAVAFIAILPPARRASAVRPGDVLRAS